MLLSGLVVAEKTEVLVNLTLRVVLLWLVEGTIAHLDEAVIEYQMIRPFGLTNSRLSSAHPSPFSKKVAEATPDLQILNLAH